MIKIIDLENIKFASVNDRYRGNFRLTKNYKDFKELLFYSMLREKLPAPYKVNVFASMYLDFDSPIKAIADSMQARKVIDNDRNILDFRIIKTPLKRGKPGALKVFIESLEGE